MVRPGQCAASVKHDHASTALLLVTMVSGAVWYETELHHRTSILFFFFFCTCFHSNKIFHMTWSKTIIRKSPPRPRQWYKCISFQSFFDSTGTLFLLHTFWCYRSHPCVPSRVLWLISRSICSPTWSLRSLIKQRCRNADPSPGLAVLQQLFLTLAGETPGCTWTRI